MTAIVVLLALLIVLGLASALGWSADTRDPDYDLGILGAVDERPRR